jgi:molybdate transport system ATP-binding protein
LPEGLEAAIRLRRGALDLAAAIRVSPGETLALVGPSGAGKSTCLAVLAGLLPPDEGRVSVDGAVWLDTRAGLDLPPERRRAGLLFQDYALFPHLTARENVAYGPRARGTPAETARERAGAWLRRLGVGADADRRPAALSGGQRQRVALARTLAAEPRLLLLDEPFASLDVRTRSVVRGELRALLEEARLPVVLVAHDPVDAFALAHRVAVLEEGRVTQEGTHAELAAAPRTPFVADLAGLNVYAVVVDAGHGLKAARAEGLELHVLADDVSGAGFAAFAPADVLLSAAPLTASARNSWGGHVRALLPLPDRVRVTVEAGATLTAEVTREAAATLALAPGRPVWASVKATSIRVYA